MKNYYPSLKTASDEQKKKLIEEIDPTQKGNHSGFKGKLAQFRISLKRVDENIELIGNGFSSAKLIKA
jgi:hypothetical protein